MAVLASHDKTLHPVFLHAGLGLGHRLVRTNGQRGGAGDRAGLDPRQITSIDQQTAQITIGDDTFQTGRVSDKRKPEPQLSSLVENCSTSSLGQVKPSPASSIFLRRSLTVHGEAP